MLASVKTVVPIPASLDLEAAATMPTVFVTVDAALHRSAAMQPGEHVLVHAAAGGVGLAAVQVIQAAGALPLTTAGSPSKRALLRSLGVQQVLGSRDTAFVDQLLELGSLADVVLNTLTSSGMVAGSLAALGAGGRFVEISKRDIWSTARLAQGELRLGAAVAAVQLTISVHACSCYNSCSAPVHLICLPRQTIPPHPPHLQSAPTCATPWWLSTSCQRLLCTLH